MSSSPSSLSFFCHTRTIHIKIYAKITFHGLLLKFEAKKRIHLLVLEKFFEWNENQKSKRVKKIIKHLKYKLNTKKKSLQRIIFSLFLFCFFLTHIVVVVQIVRILWSYWEMFITSPTRWGLNVIYLNIVYYYYYFFFCLVFRVLWFGELVDLFIFFFFFYCYCFLVRSKRICWLVGW